MSFTNGCSLLIGTSEVHSVYQCTKMFAFGTLVAAGQSPSLSSPSPPSASSPCTRLLLLTIQPHLSHFVLNHLPVRLSSIFSSRDHHPTAIQHGVIRQCRSQPSSGECQAPYGHVSIRAIQCVSPAPAYSILRRVRVLDWDASYVRRDHAILPGIDHGTRRPLLSRWVFLFIFEN